MFSKNFQYEIDIVNKCCLALLIYELENAGIDLMNMRPTCHPTLNLVGKQMTYNEDCVEQWDFRFVEEFEAQTFSEELALVGIEQFIDDNFKEHVKKMAGELASKLSRHPLCDVVFDNLPDVQPFIYSVMTDPETNVCLRLFAGVQLMENKTAMICDMHVLIVDRYREMDEGRIGIVSQMSEEDRAKYDHQPKKKEESDE